MPVPQRRRRRTVVDHDVPVVSFDGVVLATDIHRPVSDRRVGCLLQRVPYGKDVPAIVSGALDVERALERGYAVAIQDCRGRGRSDGVFEPFVTEGDDGEATIRWLAEQPWCNGRVGMFGRSYAGLVQWLVASREVPALRAIAPMFSGRDPNTGWLAPDGAVEWGFALLWCIRYLAPGELARRGGMSSSELESMIADIDGVFRRGADHPGFAELAALVPLLAEVVELERGGAARPVTDRSGAAPWARPVSTVPAFVVAGWFDIFLGGCLDAVADLSDAGVDHHVMTGPWSHGGTCPGVYPERDFGPRASAAAVGLTDRQLDWFDRWMSDDPAPGEPASDAERRPGSGATLFVTGRDEWVEEPAWPPPGLDLRRWHLTGTGVAHRDGPGDDALGAQAQLDPSPPQCTGAFTLGWDQDRPVPTIGGQTFLPGMDVAANAGPRRQNSLLGRPDVLAVVGAPVGDDEVLEAVGDVWVVLAVDDVEPGTRWCVRLVDVDDDAWMLVAEAAARPAGPVDSVAVHFRGIAHRWQSGHRPGLLISHTSSPRFSDRISLVEGRRRGATRILYGPAHPTYVDLRVRPQPPEEAP